MNRERMSQDFGESSNNSESGRPLDRKIGREAMTRFGGEAAGNEAVGDTLEGVTAAMQKLGSDAANRTSEVFSKLVRAADLPSDTKQQLISGYQEGDDFSALVDALGTQAGEVKATRREQLISKIKSKIGRAVAIGVAATVLIGAGVMMNFSNANAQDVVPENPVKIMEEVVDENDGEVEELSDDGEAEEETSILDDESLYTNSNYENFDLDKIGPAVVEHYIDTGEGYEELNGGQANFSDYNDFEHKTSKLAYNTPISDEALQALENGDRTQYVDELMTRLVNNPANAASHLAMIDPAMEAVGVPDEIRNIEDYGKRAQAVWNWVREQGGEKYAEMAGALYVAYRAETTEFEVNSRTGDDWTMYLTSENPDEPMSIENALVKGQDKIERDGAIQVTTKMNFIKSDGNEMTITYTTNAKCTQITGERNGKKVTVSIIEIHNPVTDETTVYVSVIEHDEPDETTGGGGGKKEEDGGEEDKGGDDTTDEGAKSKDAASLQQGANQALTDAGSNENINGTPEYGTSGDTGSYVNNDNTISTTDGNNNVVSVTDGTSGDTVEVTSGYTETPDAVTYQPPEVVKEAVNEGQTYTDDAAKQKSDENAQADALMSLLNNG